MSIENERKYVLKWQKEIENNMIKLAKSSSQISQGYLLVGKGKSVRIRESSYNDGTISRKMTYKQNVLAENGCPQTIEIETEISIADWLRLWPTAVSRVFKARYNIDGWEVDFFRTRENYNVVYFVMAEIELPEAQFKPDKVPWFITENLLYKVKNGDCRFSSRKLSSPKYAKKVLNKLLSRNLLYD